MIEDDIRDILLDEVTDRPIYARIIPPDLPECYSVQVRGGRTSTAGIHRSRDTVSIIAVSPSKGRQMDMMRDARDALVRALPREVNGTYYYRAVPLMDGSAEARGKRGRAYIEYTDMDIERSVQ